ncbi:MAG: carbohydrate ABC transporter permease [Anaerolineae bacterium]|nr:carbohydrate ABC transporter permease [Anaerolineae bacterium]
MSTARVQHSLTRILIYGLLILMTMFFLMPIYVLVVTGFKSFAEVDLQRLWALPSGIYFDNFIAAFDKLAPNLWNSLRLVIPSSIISSMIGSINGYVFSKYRFRYSNVIFTLILFGMFIPYQSILIPLVQFMEWLGLRGSITGLLLVHVIYGIPITTLIFRNYYEGIPTEVLEAGRIDGADMFGLYRFIVFPLSIPGFVVVLIWQFTQAYNDFLFAVVLTRNTTWPITVALNNLAGSQIVQWNVQMAGALLAALPTLLIYILLGKFFLRGLMAGALKG